MADTTETVITDHEAADAFRALREADIQFAVVEIERLHANPWNPNKMDDRTKAAARESIATYGFLDPPLVRQHPELGEGHYEIIDGEHRIDEARALEVAKVPITIAELDDVAARKLTVIFNDTRGEHDDVLLGNLLKSIKDQAGEDFTTGLRYSEGQMDHLLSLATDDWGAYAPPDPQDQEPPADAPPPVPEKWQGWGVDELAAVIEPQSGDHGKLFRALQQEAKDVTAQLLADDDDEAQA